MGQKQTLAPMIDSGSCDRQSWRIIKMKLPTGQTAAKSETKGLVLLYYFGRQHVGLCGRGRIVFGGAAAKVAPRSDSSKL